MNAPKRPEMGDLVRATVGHDLAFPLGGGPCSCCEAARQRELRELADAMAGDPDGRAVRLDAEVFEG